MLNAIHTAGYDDPILYGPQMSYGTSSWWDMHLLTELSFLTGRSGEASHPDRFNYWTTGDSNVYYRFPSDYISLASMMTYDSYLGKTDRMQALEWPILNVAFGGPAGSIGECTDHCGFVPELDNDYARGVAMDLFIALPAADPTTNPPSDPRPGLPSDLYNWRQPAHPCPQRMDGTGYGVFVLLS